MTTGSATPGTLHAWAIYLRASEEARRRGDRRTGTDHILLALFEDPSTEALLGVNLQQARQALESLDREALASVGLGSGADSPPLAMRAVPKKPRIRDVAKKDRFRMTPAAKKVLEEAYKPKGHRKLQVTGPEVLAQILALQPPDPAAVLLGALGVNTSGVLRRLDAVTDLTGEALQETSGEAAVPSKDQPRQ
jgi:Clp amino terminal domain, pathogenicity island component